LTNRYGDPACADLVAELKEQLKKLRQSYGDTGDTGDL
jgi:hypothetical protein